MSSSTSPRAWSNTATIKKSDLTGIWSQDLDNNGGTVCQLNGRILDKTDYDSIRIINEAIDEMSASSRTLYRDDDVLIKGASGSLMITIMPNELDDEGRQSPVVYVKKQKGLKVSKDVLLSCFEQIFGFMRKINRTADESALRSVASEF